MMEEGEWTGDVEVRILDEKTPMMQSIYQYKV